MTSGRFSAVAGPRTVYSVSQLTGILRALLEDALPDVWVEGEISNFARPASGHWYFTLKDARGQIRSVMFRAQNISVRPPPKEGDRVLVRGHASLYPGRGDLQLIIEHMEPAGIGALLVALEALKRKLDAEGLFAPTRKRPLPAVPRIIGLITSGTGAAVRDVLTTLARRWPLAQVVLWPVPVQGAAAAPAIVHALDGLPRREPVDVIILARGGGSLEDLWAFNEESVVRAIAACAVPVVTGVGHEIDVTLSDLAADLRAATPTAAAELVAPDVGERVRRLTGSAQALLRAWLRRRDALRASQERLERRLSAQHPVRRLLERQQRVDDLELRLRRCGVRALERSAHGFALVEGRLRAVSPQRRLADARASLGHLDARLQRHVQARLASLHSTLLRHERMLSSLSPLAVLERGYAVVRDTGGRVLGDASDAPAGAVVDILLARGRLGALVTKSEPDGRPPPGPGPARG